MTAFKGIIIEESLENKSILKKVKVISTKIEKVTPEHKTPWIKQWTLHTVEIPEDKADIIAQEISESLDEKHKSSWFVDFENNRDHYIIFPGKFFRINKKKQEEYYPVVNYAVSLGIPRYQLAFDPEWEKNPHKL